MSSGIIRIIPGIKGFAINSKITISSIINSNRGNNKTIFRTDKSHSSGYANSLFPSKFYISFPVTITLRK